MAKTLTLRLSEKEQFIVEEVKKETGQNVASKAVLRACRGFLKQKQSYMQMQLEIEQLRTECEKMKADIENSQPKQLSLIDQ